MVTLNPNKLYIHVVIGPTLVVKPVNLASIEGSHKVDP